MKTLINKIFGVKTAKKNAPFNWSALSSREQKKIIRKAVSGSNKLQRDLYEKAKVI